MWTLWVALCGLCGCAEGIRWTALSHVPEFWRAPTDCPSGSAQRRKFGLVGYQAKLCKKHIDLMPLIMRAARDTRRVCLDTFADRRWNCSSLGLAPKLSPDLTKGTREQAFVYALSSAAIAQGVAKGCAAGTIPWCPCGSLPAAPAQGFRWKGCSDNVDYGKVVSSEWADAPWKKFQRRAAKRQRKKSLRGALLADGGRGKKVSLETFMGAEARLSPRMKMNQHNNDAGRLVLANRREKKCKCHGVSSSCTVKTCWESLPSLPSVAAVLKDKYARATEVKSPRRSARGRTPEAVTGLPGEEGLNPVGLEGRVSDLDLVYVRKSPDYCTSEPRVGSLGTKGRLCNATVNSAGNCDTMCCGRGFQTETREETQNCQCKYVHCCYVKCKQCTTTLQLHYCK